MSVGSSPPMNDCKMAMRMAFIRSTDIWSMKPIVLRPKPSSCKEEDAVDIPTTDEDDEFLVDSGHLKATNIEVQRMIE